MYEQDLELAKRAVACKGWRWDMVAGAAIHHSCTMKDGTPQCRLHDMAINGYDARDGISDRTLIQTIHHLYTLIEPIDVLPDFTFPSTVGCLLAMVRKAYGTTAIWLEPDTREYGNDLMEWCVYRFDGGFATSTIAHAATEVEALVAALEAAPCNELH